MELFQFFIISMLIIVCIFLVLYGFYMYLKTKKQEEEPMITNLMVYEPPSIQ